MRAALLLRKASTVFLALLYCIPFLMKYETASAFSTGAVTFVVGVAALVKKEASTHALTELHILSLTPGLKYYDQAKDELLPSAAEW